MAEVTRCRHDEIGAESELPTDVLGYWVARGWEPISKSRPSEVAEQERIDAENVAIARVDAVVEVLATEHLTVTETLDAVEDDPDAAAAALVVEQSTENPRTTLVARLNQITKPAGDAGNTKESTS